MKVLFVYSSDEINPAREKTMIWSRVPLGISYISSLLKQNGHETYSAVLGSNHYTKSVDVITKAIVDADPGLVCFTAVFSQYGFIDRISRYVKTRWPDKYLVIGGAHATLVPEEVATGPFDAVCIGEGEYPTLELCRQLESQKQPHGIRNLWIRSSDGALEKNQPRDFIENLEEFPFPDLEMWKPWVAPDFDDGMTILGGRGCPYDCTYCCNSKLRKTAGGRYVRTRPTEGILDEIRTIQRSFPENREIFIEMETLDCNREWTIELCNKIETFNSGLPEPIVFGSNYRVNPRTIDESLFSALRRANFGYINIGLESGSERVRRDILNRTYTNEDFLKVVSLARENGLKIYVYNMIGLPGESLQDHRETIRINRQCQPDGHHTGIFYPYPGTELHNVCIRNKLIESGASAGAERRQPVMDLAGFPRAEIKKAYLWFDYHVYKGHKPILTILTHYTLNKTRTGRIIKYGAGKCLAGIRALLPRGKAGSSGQAPPFAPCL